MIRTLSLEDLKKKTKTIFEAVDAIAKRARQINSMRRSQIDMGNNSEDPIDETFEDLTAEIETKLYEKKDKPTRQAIQEMLDGKLEIKYPEVKEKPEDES